MGLTYDAKGRPWIRIAVQGQEVRIRSNKDGFQSLIGLMEQFLSDDVPDWAGVYLTPGLQLAEDSAFVSFVRGSAPEALSPEDS